MARAAGASAAASVATAAALLTRAAAAARGAADPAPRPHASALASPARVAQPTPGVALRQPASSPAPPAAPAAGETYLGLRAFTATDQARHAESSVRTQNSARRPTEELTSLHVRYKNALRAVLTAVVTRPAELADLGSSAVACISSTLAAQTDLAHAVLADVERLAARSRTARTTYGRLRKNVRDQTTCYAITRGEVTVEPGVVETLNGIFPFGGVMAALAASVFAPSGDQDFSRSFLDTARHQTLMVQGEFDPSAAVVAINKAIQKGKQSQCFLD